MRSVYKGRISQDTDYILLGSVNTRLSSALNEQVQIPFNLFRRVKLHCRRLTRLLRGNIGMFTYRVTLVVEECCLLQIYIYIFLDVVTFSCNNLQNCCVISLSKWTQAWKH